MLGLPFDRPSHGSTHPGRISIVRGSWEKKRLAEIERSESDLPESKVQAILRGDSLYFELGVVAALAVGLFAVSALFDAYETFHEWSRSHEHLELDEVLFPFLGLAAGLVWVAVRRWKSYAKAHDLAVRQNAQLIAQSGRLARLAEDIERARDEAQAASEAKTQFLAAMSHELRTPLNAIIGFSEVIKEESLGPVGSTKYLEYVTDIHYSGQHLLHLINDLLDLAKIELGEDELCEERTEIEPIARAAVKLVQQQAEDGAIELASELREGLPQLWGGRAEADPDPRQSPVQRDQVHRARRPGEPEGAVRGRQRPRPRSCRHGRRHSPGRHRQGADAVRAGGQQAQPGKSKAPASACRLPRPLPNSMGGLSSCKAGSVSEPRQRSFFPSTECMTRSAARRFGSARTRSRANDRSARASPSPDPGRQSLGLVHAPAHSGSPAWRRPSR